MSAAFLQKTRHKSHDTDMRKRPQTARSDRQETARTQKPRNVALFAAAVCVLTSGSYFRGPTVPQPRKNDVRSVLPLAEMVAAPGYWRFAGWDGQLQSSTVSPGKVDALLARAATIRGQSDEQMPTIDSQIVNLAELAGMQVSHDGEYTVIRHDESTAKAVAVLHTSETRHRLASAAVATRNANDPNWQFMQIANAATNQVVELNIALPLPNDIERVCSRVAEDGRPILEVISLDTNATSLIDVWKQRGWTVRRSGLGDGYEFSFLCSLGRQTVYCFSPDPPSELRNLMVMDTSPDSKLLETAGASHE